MKTLTLTIPTVISTPIDVEVQFPCYLKDEDGKIHFIEYNPSETYAPFKQMFIKNWQSGSLTFSTYDLTEESFIKLWAQSKEVTLTEYVNEMHKAVQILKNNIEERITS